MSWLICKHVSKIIKLLSCLSVVFSLVIVCSGGLQSIYSSTYVSIFKFMQQCTSQTIYTFYSLLLRYIYLSEYLCFFSDYVSFPSCPVKHLISTFGNVVKGTLLFLHKQKQQFMSVYFAIISSFCIFYQQFA